MNLSEFKKLVSDSKDINDFKSKCLSRLRNDVRLKNQPENELKEYFLFGVDILSIDDISKLLKTSKQNLKYVILRKKGEKEFRKIVYKKLAQL